MITSQAARLQFRVTEFNNEEALLQRINPDLYRIYRAIKVIDSFGGHGSFEVHMKSGKIRDINGLYIKPSFDLSNFDSQIKELNKS